ncbi:MAG: hypothetical protein M3Z50_12595, partial [Actinomycetota bacterium]|nr:hypothetical protein [Actinomycetota bacterium]
MARRHQVWPGVIGVLLLVALCSHPSTASRPHAPAPQAISRHPTTEPAPPRTTSRARHPKHHRGTHGRHRAKPPRSGIYALLHRVRIVSTEPYVPGYDRSCSPGHACSFGSAWSDDTTAPDGHNGCDTRHDVLREQLHHVVLDSNGCTLASGLLVDPYTGSRMQYATEGSQIQIDHLVALATAWRMGAAHWPLSRRMRFANDT